MQLQSLHKQLAQLGFQLIAICPDRPEKLRESVKKNKIDFLVLSDSKMVAAQAFGIAFELNAETRNRYKGYGIDLEEASGKGRPAKQPIRVARPASVPAGSAFRAVRSTKAWRARTPIRVRIRASVRPEIV